MFDFDWAVLDLQSLKLVHSIEWGISHFDHLWTYYHSSVLTHSRWLIISVSWCYAVICVMIELWWPFSRKITLKFSLSVTQPLLKIKEKSSLVHRIKPDQKENGLDAFGKMGCMFGVLNTSAAEALFFSRDLENTERAC